ncbi:MAG TPA: radical SAM protein [Vicinamibacterales bacterium]|jgi:MoaA/NifB/PqqE/SkfB family radical SAM enzyme
MRELSIHVTDRCNFRCQFCVWGDRLVREGGDVAAADIEVFLESNRDQGFERVNLHGGEPTLRRDLFDVLASVRAFGYPSVSLQTNGWALADRAFVERLAAAGVSLFIVSVHGPTADIHDDLCGVPGGLSRALRGIEHAAALGCAVRTNTVVTTRNFSLLAATVERVIAAGASHVNISSLMPAGRAAAAGAALMPRFDRIAPHVVAAVRVALDRGVVATLEGFPSCAAPELAHLCLARDDRHGHQITCLIHGVIWQNHDAYVASTCKTKGASCAACALTGECGGVYRPYVQLHGWDEFQPQVAGAA